MAIYVVRCVGPEPLKEIVAENNVVIVIVICLEDDVDYGLAVEIWTESDVYPKPEREICAEIDVKTAVAPSFRILVKICAATDSDPSPLILKQICTWSDVDSVIVYVIDIVNKVSIESSA